MNTYGIHGIHGRAAAIATGVKLSNPKLSVWMITGDGDCMAIGGNHFIHSVRRNIDLNIMLFNNKIYGLTKGQFSPTTPEGTKTKSSPQGTFEPPFFTGELVIGAQGNFFARAVDNNPKMMVEVMLEAAKYKGASVVEILQNCVIFNNKTHDAITNRETRDDNQLMLKHGKPMIFGKNNDKGLILKGTQLKVVNIRSKGYGMEDILVHDKHNTDPGIHVMLSRMAPPEFPAAMGVIRSIKSEPYDQRMTKLIDESKKTSKLKSTQDLLQSGNTWTI
ncbi:MAG: thiamine pyrophosphate-dependent enzyme [Bacteroidota bacterium]|nr:thiamine pyrophosphate-dependent enzyme [Bacteroidota bacterium]